MSWWLEDQNGYLGDFASTGGLQEMHDLPPAKFPALHKFLAAGEADAALAETIAEETANTSEFNYLARLMRAAEPPVILTDGASGGDDE